MTSILMKQVTTNKEGKEVAFPADVKTLTSQYNKTESGLFFKVLKVTYACAFHFSVFRFSTNKH